jgi:UTP--glucose-1-phosphate uridylyltransferase
MEITKVIIPAAGHDERFLPLSKTLPKEMWPLLCKPAIHHLAQEAVDSALNTIIMVTSQRSGMVADYFDPSAVQSHVKASDSKDHLAALDKIQKSADIITMRQHEPLGTGHAIWLARNTLQKEHFGVAIPDDLIVGKQPALAQLMRIARQEKASVLAVQEVPNDCISQYGVIGIKKTITPNLFQVSQVVDKPQAKDAPSSLALVGRFILSSKIMSTIDTMIAYNQQNISLTEAIGQLLHSNERVFAVKVQGTRYDIGSHLGYIKAVIGTSLQDPEMGPAVRAFLSNFDTPESFLYNPAKMIQDNF